MEKRTKTLITILVVTALLVAGFYGYKYFIEEKPAPPKMRLTLMAPVARSKGHAAKAAPAATGPSAAQPAAAEKHAIIVIEKGREVQYKSPEDFTARTEMSILEANMFASKKLDDAKKALQPSVPKAPAIAAPPVQAPALPSNPFGR